jgi:hypothetical protein
MPPQAHRADTHFPTPPHSLNLLVAVMPAALVPELDRYVQARRHAPPYSARVASLTHPPSQALVALAHDTDPDVRKLVCEGLVEVMRVVPDRLQSCLREVVQYMLDRNQARRNATTCHCSGAADTRRMRAAGARHGRGAGGVPLLVRVLRG